MTAVATEQRRDGGIAPPMKARAPKRVLATSAIVVTPLAFTACLLLALPVGVVNAAIIAVVPALFAAGYFGGFYLLAHAIERDERAGTLREPELLVQQAPGPSWRPDPVGTRETAA